MNGFKGKDHDNRIRKGHLIWIVAAAVTMTGCQALNPQPATAPVVTTGSGTLPDSHPGTGMDLTTAAEAGSTGSSAPGTETTTAATAPAATTGITVPLTQVSTTTGSVALDRFTRAREALRSEVMTHLWSVESNFPLKTGAIIRAVNYGEDGQMTTGWGSSEESEGIDSEITMWYRTQEELILAEDGAFRRYPLSEVRPAEEYDLAGLIRRMLSEYSVNLESGAYYVKLTTQNENLIRTMMEDLGYRKTEADAYQGNLYLEASLDEVTGNLLHINYVFRHRVDGYTDNGSLSFRDWNIPVQVVIPEDPASAADPAGTDTQP